MKLTMSCYSESQCGTPERRASWHETCVEPGFCPCPAHEGEVRKTPAQAAATRWPTTPRVTKNSGLK